MLSSRNLLVIWLVGFNNFSDGYLTRNEHSIVYSDRNENQGKCKKLT